MRRLGRDAPRLDVKVVAFLASMLGDLRDGRLSLGFGIAEQPLPPRLRSEPLHGDSFVEVLRAGHPALAAWSLETFLALDHVLVTVLGGGRGALDEALKEMALARRATLRLLHFFAALSVVAESELVVKLLRSIALRHASALGQVALEPPLPRDPFTTVVIWPEMLDADPGITWLRGVVREEAERITGTTKL